MANKENNTHEDNNADIGRFARHPLRTMGGSLLTGMSIGAGMMATKQRRAKNPMQRFMDRLNARMH